MEGTGVEVQRQGDDIKLIMPGNITFATDSANIAPSFYAPLNNLANSFKQYNQNTIEIVGYTDSTGSRQHNMDLSQRRAQSVAGYLTAQGVDGTRLSTRGMGPDQPIASNSTADGRAQNRRVEVNLRPVPGAQGADPAAVLIAAWTKKPAIRRAFHGRWSALFVHALALPGNSRCRLSSNWSCAPTAG